jgi:hypothetical protein
MSTPARILLVEGDTVPPAPTAGQVLFYAKTSGTFYSQNSLGVEVPFSNNSSGTVTSVAATGSQGISISGSPITGSGTLTLGLGAITPASVAATGTVTGSNLSGLSSGTNTGDQTAVTGNAGTATVLATGRTISITGDLAYTSPIFNGSANITAAGTLATVNANVGTFGSATQVPVFTVNAKGLVTGVTNTLITGGIGTVTSVAATGSQGISVSGSPITGSGTLTLGLGAITPTSVAATGAVSGSNLSGTNTGNQTITLTGDVTGSGTGSFAATLVTVTAAKGGTGQTTYTAGDILYASGAASLAKLPVGTAGQVLTVAAGIPSWAAAGGSTAPEVTVFNYSPGSAGNFAPVDVIYSQTSGVTATVTDGTNCIVTYAFTGKSNPPKSITTYGQNFTTNTFIIKDTTSLPSALVAGGGTATAPDLANGIFNSSNIVTLQTRMSDTGASSGLGQRAWCVVVFGF